VRSALPVLLAALALAGGGCRGAAPSGGPAPAPSPAPDAPTPAPERPDAGAEDAAPAEGPAPAPPPLLLRIDAPAGSALRLDGRQSRLPGAVELAEPGPRRVAVRLCLNPLSEALEIPPGASERLSSDDDGVWMVVRGTVALGPGDAGEAELVLGRPELLHLLGGDPLELGGPEERVHLRLGPP